MANNTRPYDNRNIVSKYIHYKLLKRGYVWDSHVGRESGSPNNNGLLGSSPSSSPVLVRRPVPDPGEGPSLLVNRTPRVDPHADLHKVLREAGDEISRRYQREFAEMAGQLHFTPTTVQRKFESVVEELFRDGVNWGRIVAFFEFGGTMCVESVNREMTSQVDNIANWMTEYLNGPLQNWIQENGGWDAFVELYGSQRGSMSNYSWPSLKTALSLAALGAAGITIGAYFVQK